MCVRVGIPFHPQDNFLELVLTFHLDVGSKDGTQANRLAQIEPLNMSHLTGSSWQLLEIESEPS